MRSRNDANSRYVICTKGHGNYMPYSQIGSCQEMGARLCVITRGIEDRKRVKK